MKFEKLPIFVRWAVFVGAIYFSATTIKAVVWAWPTRQADLSFNLEYLFWLWVIPTVIHYAVLGVLRLVERWELRKPLPGPSPQEAAWRAFFRRQHSQD